MCSPGLLCVSAEFESMASIHKPIFTEKLLDNSSQEFKDLEADFCKAVSIFREIIEIRKS